MTHSRITRLTGLLFVAPSLLIVVLLLIYPVVSSVFYSFTNRHLLRPDVAFVGIDNFVAVLQSE
ncbi:sugar ABC transporter permease, partial [Microbacterium keratanolyticum]